jgi:hypothetical protein
VERGLISKEFVERAMDVLKNTKIDENWLKKYTLAPWPNKLREIQRFK